MEKCEFYKNNKFQTLHQRQKFFELRKRIDRVLFEYQLRISQHQEISTKYHWKYTTLYLNELEFQYQVSLLKKTYKIERLRNLLLVRETVNKVKVTNAKNICLLTDCNKFFSLKEKENADKISIKQYATNSNLTEENYNRNIIGSRINIHTYFPIINEEKEAKEKKIISEERSFKISRADVIREQQLEIEYKNNTTRHKLNNFSCLLLTHRKNDNKHSDFSRNSCVEVFHRMRDPKQYQKCSSDNHENNYVMLPKITMPQLPRGNNNISIISKRSTSLQNNNSQIPPERKASPLPKDKVSNNSMFIPIVPNYYIMPTISEELGTKFSTVLTEDGYGENAKDISSGVGVPSISYCVTDDDYFTDLDEANRTLNRGENCKDDNYLPNLLWDSNGNNLHPSDALRRESELISELQTENHNICVLKRYIPEDMVKVQYRSKRTILSYTFGS